MKQRDNSQPLSEYIQINDAYLGGRQRGGKRGRGADGKTPYIAAISTNEEGHPMKMRLSQVECFSKEEVADWAKKYIEPGSVVVSDGLNCFPGVKDAGCAHIPIIKRGGPDSIEIPEFKWVNTMIGNIKNAISGTYHSMRKKHVPRYLAEFCYRFYRCFQLDQMVAGLVYVAIRTAPLPQRLLKLADAQW